MTPQEYAICDMIYTLIEQNMVSPQIPITLYNNCSTDQRVFIDWLLLRWTHIRTDKFHRPKQYL